MLKKMMFLCMALIAPVGLSIPAQAQSFSYYHGPHMRGAWGGYYGYHRYPAYGGYRYGYYRMHRPYWRQDGAAPYGYAYQPFGDGFYGTYDYAGDRFGIGSQR